jgi:hypothetical protein
MSNLQMLIETTENLVKNLDKASQNEKQFCYDVCMELEKMSWETFRMMNDLKQIKNYCEGLYV